MQSSARTLLLAAAVSAVTFAAGAVAAPVPPNLLGPLPTAGKVPSIVPEPAGLTKEDFDARAAFRQYRQTIRKLRRTHFAGPRDQDKRAEGIELLREFTDRAAFGILLEELMDSGTDVREAVFNHLAGQGDIGQGALAWAAIHHGDTSVRREAMRRLTVPASDPVLREIERGLRSSKHAIANNAGVLTQALGAFEAIPLLVYSLTTADLLGQDGGDIAWIAIETQRAFVANLVPVVGDNAGAFQPVIGVVSEGIVLTIRDAYAIVYRTEIHGALVDLSSRLYGQPVDHGYDPGAWRDWYNTSLLPKLQDRAALERYAESAAPLPPDPLRP